VPPEACPNQGTGLPQPLVLLSNQLSVQTAHLWCRVCRHATKPPGCLCYLTTQRRRTIWATLMPVTFPHRL
jgi:hypothetical protein